MNDQMLLTKLRDIFAETLEIDQDISENTHAFEIKGWDSLNHIRLMAAIEDHFGIKFSVKEMRSIMSVTDILKFLREKF